MTENKIIKLKYPVPLKTKKDGVDVDIKVYEIVLGRIKAKHLKLLPKGAFDNDEDINLNPNEMLPLIAGMSNLPLETVEEIDAEDLGEIGEALSDFLSQSLGTGKTSSIK